MREKIVNNLPPWEWLTLIAVICTAGVSVTVFAFSTFEAAGSAEKVRSEIKSDLSRVEVKVDALLLDRGLNPNKFKADE